MKNKHELPGSQPLKLPVSISYMKVSPPDSIKDFMKLYLRSKKVEVIDWKEVVEMFQKELQEEMMTAMNSGKFGGMNEAKANDFVSSVRPVSNLLALGIFKDTTVKNDFIIDSIHWIVSSMPVKEKNPARRLFIPDKATQTNPFYILKAFSDTVLASGQLK